MLGIIIWIDIKVYGSELWYPNNWNTTTVVILHRKQFWNNQPSNWNTVLSGNCINSSLPSHTWHLNLGRNAILIGLGSVEYCDSCLCDIGIRAWIIVCSITASNFNPLEILCLILTSWTLLDHFWTPGLFLIFLHSSLEKNPVISEMSTPFHYLLLTNFSFLTCEKFIFL